MNKFNYILFLCSIKYSVLNVVNCATLKNNNIATSMASSVDYTNVPIEEKPLHMPPLEEIVEVLSRRLPATFEFVKVTAENSPDLTQPPYNLTAPGLTGETKLIELGGPPYLVPLVQRDKVYDLAALLRHLGRDPAFLAGAGAGPWPYIGVNCEGIINMYVNKDSVEQGTRVVSVEPVGARKGSAGYLQRQLPNNETRTALLGNYLLSEGKPGKANHGIRDVNVDCGGNLVRPARRVTSCRPLNLDLRPLLLVMDFRKVIKIVAKKRIGESNFITAIREALKEHFGEKVVGLGGTFLLREGKVKHHVMPDFSSTPVCSDAEVEDWLHYFEMQAPIVHVGTLVTGDLGLDLRVQHFHGFSQHGDGGHYHYDTTPHEVHYEGYFALAAAVVRVDAPQDTHSFGRD